MSLWAHDVRDLACRGSSANSTGVNYEEAKSIIKQFCVAKAGMSYGPSAYQSSSYKTGLGNSDILLNITYTTSQTYDTTCHSNTDIQVEVVEGICEKAFYRLLDECDTSAHGYLGRYGGVVASGCGVYTMSTPVEEVIRCGGNPYPRSTNLDQDIMMKGIDDYCARSQDLTPDYTYTDRFFMQAAAQSGTSFGNYLDKGVVVKAVTQFNGQGQVDCGPSKPFNTKGNECRRKLYAVQNQCGGEGGGLSESGLNGCVLWTLWGQRAN